MGSSLVLLQHVTLSVLGEQLRELSGASYLVIRVVDSEVANTDDDLMK